MKKTISLLFVSLLMLHALSCSGNSNNNYGVLGKTSDKTYENDNIKIGITLSDSWSIASDDQLAAYNGFFEESMFSTATTVSLDDGEVITVFAASSTENAAAIELSVTAPSSEEEYGNIKEMLEKSAPDAAAVLEILGASDIEYEVTEKNFADVPATPFLKITSTVDGEAKAQAQTMFAAEKYLYTLTVTAPDSETVDETLEMFYKI